MGILKIGLIFIFVKGGLVGSIIGTVGSSYFK